MKHACSLLLLALFIFSCNSEETKSEPTVKSASTEASPAYAYTIENPDQWETGSKENTRIALQAIKDYETGNLDASMAAFADTVMLKVDMMDARISNDSLKSIIGALRKERQNVIVTMGDFESVKSKVNGEEYVTLWYKEKWQNASGQWDSISAIDDLKMKAGKIIEMDEKTRRYGKKM
jgi:hypothetical protein